MLFDTTIPDFPYFERFSRIFENQRCVKIVSGVGTWLDLYFSFPDEKGIFFREAAWRLEKGAVSVCSSAFKSRGPVNELSQSRLDLLKALLHKKLLRIEITSPVFDLALYFEDELILRAFCQGVEADSDYYMDDGKNNLSITAEKAIFEQKN